MSRGVVLAVALLTGAAAVPAPAAEPACLECHTPIKELLESKFKHAAVEGGCDTCHIDHNQPAAAGQTRLPRFLNASQPELCLNCHDIKEARIASVHGKLGADKAVCSACHNPHGSSRAKLLAAQPHVPFDKGRCQACHAGVASRQFVHAAVQTGCTVCHDAAAPSHRPLLRAEVNAVCLECHAASAGAKFEQDGPVELFDKQVVLPPRPFKEVKLIPELAGGTSGHPVPMHPVVRTGEKGGRMINCVTCHDPHSSDSGPELLAAGVATSSALCLKCH